MDYLGWELERQRQALAALLLGGGTAEDREALRNGERRRLEAEAAAPAAAEWTDFAGAAAAERMGRAGEASQPAAWAWNGGMEPWKTARTAEPERLGRLTGAEAPLSAWEGVLGLGEAGVPSGKGWSPEMAAALERKLREAAADVPAGAVDTAPEAEDPARRTADRDGNGTASGGREARSVQWRAVSKRKGDIGTVLRTVESREALQEAADGGWASGWTFGGEAFSGNSAAARSLTPPEAAVRGGGSGTAAPGQSRIFPGAEKIEYVGAAAWDGLGSAALRTEDGARALSRAVQRDARRYDGGFSIY